MNQQRAGTCLSLETSRDRLQPLTARRREKRRKRDGWSRYVWTRAAWLRSVLSECFLNYHCYSRNNNIRNSQGYKCSCCTQITRTCKHFEFFFYSGEDRNKSLKTGINSRISSRIFPGKGTRSCTPLKVKQPNKQNEKHL